MEQVSNHEAKLEKDDHSQQLQSKAEVPWDREVTSVKNKSSSRNVEKCQTEGTELR
jgi:hypothetical protein